MLLLCTKLIKVRPPTPASFTKLKALEEGKEQRGNYITFQGEGAVLMMIYLSENAGTNILKLDLPLELDVVSPSSASPSCS